MARVLLVSTNREARLWTVMPNGVCAVANATAAAGHTVEVVDLRFQRRPHRALRSAIRRFGPDVIGCSIRNIDSAAWWQPQFYLPFVRDTVVPTCRGASNAPIVVGGPAVSVGRGPLVDYVGADYGIAGEGESAFPELLARLAQGAPPAGVPGLLTRGEPTASDWSPARCTSLDAQGPLTPERWIDVRRYWRAKAPYPLLTRRGCPFGCTYCAYPGVEGPASRLRAADALRAEVAAARAIGARRIEIVDSIFNVPEPRAIEVCAAIAEVRGDAAIEIAGLHPGGVSPAMCRALEGAGVHGALCTPDAFSATGLTGLRKGFGMDVVERAVATLAPTALDVCWFCILGAPGESAQSIDATLDFIEHRIPAHHVVLVNIGLRVYPGTPLAAHCRERGLPGSDGDFLEPTWFAEPALPMEHLLDRLGTVAARCPNIVVMGEEAADGWMPRLVGPILRRIARGRPAWAGLPKLFGFLQRFRDRRALLRVRPQPRRGRSG